MKRYVQRYREWRTTGVDNIRDSKACCPSILDDDAIVNIRKHLKEAVATQTCQTSMLSAFIILTEAKACETKKEEVWQVSIKGFQKHQLKG
jgi:hypothetical protein